MKITDIKSAVAPERIKPQENSPQPSGAPATPPSGPRDRVTVGTSRPAEPAVASARRAAGAERTARLDRLESQVRSGKYSPDPSRVAEQILSDAEVDARLQALLSR
jgi:anti-sigma28 factor (negative regulator of flagellin synthesis)